MRWPSAKITALAGLLLAGSGCLGSIATRSLADSFAGGGSGYSSDDDPELVRAAIPFALKTMEQVLEAQPRHVGLLTALARSFTQFAYAFVQQDVDRLEDGDAARWKEGQGRVRRLYLRARDYGLRGLEVEHPGFAGFAQAAPAERARLLGACAKADVPLLYWTAVPWTLAVASGKDQMKLVGELPAVEAMMARALELDETWDGGAIHDFYVAYDGARSAAEGGGPEKAKAHLARGQALGENRRLGPIVSYAETVLVAGQDRKEFTRLLTEVAAADVDKHPADRLANLVAQRRARWLLSRTGELFAE